MTVPSRGYLPGVNNVLTVCDRCGETRRRHEMAKEWTNLIVCRDTCLDPVDPRLTPPRIWPEGVPVPDARPLPEYVFVTPGPLDPDAL